MPKSQCTLKQFTNLNKSSSQLDFLIYLEHENVIKLNTELLKVHKTHLLKYVEHLIFDWKQQQIKEFEEKQNTGEL
jgi:hypothetical protein